MLVIIVGIFGISMSAILVRYSTAPSAVTAAWRLVWSVMLLFPVVMGSTKIRQELRSMDKKTAIMQLSVIIMRYWWPGRPFQVAKVQKNSNRGAYIFKIYVILRQIGDCA